MSKERKASASNDENVEIDLDFLGKLGSFKVLDAWDETSDKSAVKIKEEPLDENTSRSSRKRSSDHRVSSSSRLERRIESREKSWERRPRDPRQLRARSPPRNRSPPRKAANAFLEDLKMKMGNLGQDTSFIDDYKNPRHGGRNNQNYYNDLSQQQFAQQQQQQQNMMMNNYPQMMPNMMQMNYQQFNPQIQYDIYGNPLMIPPLMNNMDIPPQPVPPPIVAPGTISPHQYVSPEPLIIPNQQQQTNGNNLVTKQNNNAMKKALLKGNLNLTDILRQKSKQQSKESLQSAVAATKAKVKERCQKAFEVIIDSEKMKTIMPFTCALTKVQTPQVKQISTNKNTSPLLLSDHNAIFQFQTPPSRCRTAFDRNPLKVFQEPSKIMLPLARNMKLDMLEVSLKVKEQVLSKPKEKEVKKNPSASFVPVPSTSRAVNIGTSVPQFQDKAIQAALNCFRCSERDEKKRTAQTKGTQTKEMLRVDAGTQCDNDDGSLSFKIDADRLRSLTFQEHHLLKSFSETFGFRYDEVIASPVRSVSSSTRRNVQSAHMEDDRLNNYANPENPAQNPFISFSPTPQRSIFARIGEKINTRSPSPDYQYERVNEYIVPSPPRHDPPMYRNRSRSLSPFSRSSGGRNRSPIRNRSPGRSQSPLHRNPNARNRSPLRMRSPKRTRIDEDDWKPKHLPIKDRRGRY